MNKQYVHYDQWEDYKSGMYDLPSSTDDSYHIFMSANLLANPEEFFNIALKMIESWQTAAKVNLSNRQRNRQAWIGQASCCYAFGAKEHQTKEAWHTLSKDQQDAANKIADEVIEIWESINA